MFRRQSRRQTKLGGLQGLGVANPTIASLEHPGSASHDADSDDMDFSVRKSRFSVSQLQAQLSRLMDRTRLRRLKNTLLSKGGLAASDKNRRLVPRSGLPQVAAPPGPPCAESVLTPHDDITNAQKRFGNRVLVGGGQCRCCGSFLDPQLERAASCSTAEATGGHCACLVVCGIELAEPGYYNGPRWLTASHSMPAGHLPPQLSPDAVRPWTCVASSIAAAAGGRMLHRRHSIVNCRITEMESES